MVFFENVYFSKQQKSLCYVCAIWFNYFEILCRGSGLCSILLQYLSITPGALYWLYFLYICIRFFIFAFIVSWCSGGALTAFVDNFAFLDGVEFFHPPIVRFPWIPFCISAGQRILFGLCYCLALSISPFCPATLWPI